MTTKALVQRVQRLEAARVARWWLLCGELHGELLATLTDAQLDDVDKGLAGGYVPDWWPALVDAFVADDPRWIEVCRLEQSLLAVGYQLVTENGVVVPPGLERAT